MPKKTLRLTPKRKEELPFNGGSECELIVGLMRNAVALTFSAAILGARIASGLAISAYIKDKLLLIYSFILIGPFVR